MTSEAQWQAEVVELARICGWRCMHVRRSIGKGHRWTTATSCDGWPDLVLWRRGEFIAAELKTETGKVTDEQEAVLASLREAEVPAYVWRPRDLEAVAKVLGKRKALVGADLTADEGEKA